MVAARPWISRQAVGGQGDDRLASGGLDRVAGVGPAVLHHRGQGRRQVGAAGRPRPPRPRRPMRPSACVRRARWPRGPRPSRAAATPGPGPARGRRRGPRRGCGTGRSRGPSAAAGPGPAISNSTVDAGPLAPLAGRATERRDEPEVVEDHRPDVEDERLRGVERLLDHRDQLADLALRQGRVLADEPLDDLGLEDDVGQALGRAVVHRPGDLAAQVLLGRQQHPRDGRLALGRGRGPGAAAAPTMTPEPPDRGRRPSRRRRPWPRGSGPAPRACPRGRRPATPSGRRAW